jgi:hypothetical protein
VRYDGNKRWKQAWGGSVVKCSRSVDEGPHPDWIVRRDALNGLGKFSEHLGREYQLERVKTCERNNYDDMSI